MSYAFGRLRDCAWNSCGVSTRRLELLGVLEEQNIDMLLIGKTWLRPGDIFLIHNYNTISSDRLSGRGGGAAIVVHKTIIHSRIFTPVLHSLEEVGVRFSVYGLDPLNTYSIYASPSGKFVTGD